MQGHLSSMHEQGNAVKSQYHCATLVGNWEEERRGFGPQSNGEDGFGATLTAPPTSGGPRLPIDGNTTYTTSYKDLSAEERDAVKQLAGCLVAEAPRELLFYHGDLAKPTEKNLLTLAEMSYRNPATEEPYTNDEILDRTGVSQRKDKTATLRRSMGFAASSGKEEDATASAAIEKESALIRSLVQPVEPAAAYMDTTATGSEAADSTSGSASYVAPRMPPVGRVAARDALLTTKNVTIDATGEHLYENLEAYPLTSSVCVGKCMASKNDPMHKTHLRVEYQLTR